MDTSREKVILGLFVLDRIITSKSRESTSNDSEHTNLTLGGPPTFMLFISEILREIFPIMKKPTIFSFISKQTKSLLEKLSYSNHIDICLRHLNTSPKFILDYSQPTTERKLTLFNPPEVFHCDSFDWQFPHPPIFIISSVHHEFDSIQVFSFLRKIGSFVAFDPQGCFRTVVKDGKVSYSEWFSQKILAQTDCIKLSDNETKLLGLGSDEEKIICYLLSISPRYVLVTKGGKGALFGVKDQNSNRCHIYSVPAYTVEKVTNETGAGDVFLYGFISFLQLLGDELDAIAYATSLASLLIEYGFDKEKFTLHEIKYRQKTVHSQIRKIYVD